MSSTDAAFPVLQDVNHRSILGRWIDDPQRLGVRALLTGGLTVLLHAGVCSEILPTSPVYRSARDVNDPAFRSLQTY